nr:hypothetical protein [Tanacetum cinerariifolium]
MQTQTSNTHNAIMEAGGKDRPPMLAPDKEVPTSEGSSVTTTKMYMETYTNVSQDIRDQLNAKAEAVQIIVTGIDNDIYSTVDACPNACEMWKAIESYDEEPSMVAEDDEMSKDKEIDKLMALISLSLKKIYKPTNNNLRTSSNTSTMVVQKYGIQCYNCNEFGHVARECQKPKWVKDAAYHKEKMLLCKQGKIENHNKFLETSNKVLIEHLKGEIEDFKNKNKSLESSNNRFKEANNRLSETNKLLYNDFKNSQAELERRNDVEYASKRKISLKKWKSKKAAKENWPKAILASVQRKQWEFIPTVKHFKLAQI